MRLHVQNDIPSKGNTNWKEFNCIGTRSWYLLTFIALFIDGTSSAA